MSGWKLISKVSFLFFVVSELEKLVGELSIGVIKTKRKQEQYEVRMESHHNSK